MRRALVAAILAILAAGAVPGARQEPQLMAWLRVPHGDAGIGAGIDGPPYTPGQRLRVYLVNPTPGAKTEDGLVVSGFSIHGWKEGDTIRVVVLAALPPERSRANDSSGCEYAVMRRESLSASRRIA